MGKKIVKMVSSTGDNSIDVEEDDVALWRARGWHVESELDQQVGKEIDEDLARFDPTQPTTMGTRSQRRGREVNFGSAIARADMRSKVQ